MFEWLKTYQQLEDHILFLKWNLNKSKLELARWIDGDLSNVHIEKGSRSSFLENDIEKMEEDLKSIEEDKVELINLINTFKGIDHKILKLKYIDGLNLEQIAEEVGYSPSHIRKKHADIRGKLDFLEDYQAKNADRQKKLGELDLYDGDKALRSKL